METQDEVLAAAKAEAEKEFLAEEFRKQVELEKARLRKREQFWIKWFPWRLRIERIDRLKPSEAAETEISYLARTIKQLEDWIWIWMAELAVREEHGKILSHMVDHVKRRRI